MWISTNTNTIILFIRKSSFLKFITVHCFILQCNKNRGQRVYDIFFSRFLCVEEKKKEKEKEIINLPKMTFLREA